MRSAALTDSLCFGVSL